MKGSQSISVLELLVLADSLGDARNEYVVRLVQSHDRQLADGSIEIRNTLNIPQPRGKCQGVVRVRADIAPLTGRVDDLGSRRAIRGIHDDLVRR